MGEGICAFCVEEQLKKINVDSTRDLEWDQDTERAFIPISESVCPHTHSQLKVFGMNKAVLVLVRAWFQQYGSSSSCFLGDFTRIAQDQSPAEVLSSWLNSG